MFIDGSADFPEWRRWAAFGFEWADRAIGISRPVHSAIVFRDAGARCFIVPPKLAQLFSSRTGEDVSVVMILEVFNGKVGCRCAWGLEERDMRLDLFLIDHPA